MENVLVSLHSLKTMGLGPEGASAPLFLRNGEVLGHSPIRKLISRRGQFIRPKNNVVTRYISRNEADEIVLLSLLSFVLWEYINRIQLLDY